MNPEKGYGAVQIQELDPGVLHFSQRGFLAQTRGSGSGEIHPTSSDLLVDPDNQWRLKSRKQPESRHILHRVVAACSGPVRIPSLTNGG